MGAPVFRFYNVSQVIQIESDVSQTVLGVCLAQKENSRIHLQSNDTSGMRYTQIEREILATCLLVTNFTSISVGKDGACRKGP